MHDVAVLHDVLLAFDADLARVAAGFFRTQRHVVVVFDHFGADESLLEIGVDDAGRLRGLHAADVGPCARLVGAGGEERFEVEQFVGRFDQALDARLFETEIFEEHLPLLVALQLGDVGFGGGGDDEHFGFFVGDGRTDRLGVGVARGGALLIDVADVQHRFVGQQVEVGDQFAVLLLQFDRAGAAALLQHRFVLQQQFDLTFGVLVAAHGRLLLGLAQPVFDRFEVLELQLGVDDTLVAHGVDRAVHMGDVAVVEAAQYVDDGVRVADVGEELVAQSFAFRRAFDQSGDIDDFDGGRNHPLGFVDLGQPDEPPVGDGDYAHVGFDGAKGKVSRLRLRVGQAVEKGRFADVRKTHDATL